MENIFYIENILKSQRNIEIQSPEVKIWTTNKLTLQKIS